MTTKELTLHPLFSLCTTHEKVFLIHYLQSHGNIADAAKKAYPNSVSNIHGQIRKLQRREHIATLLTYLDGQEKPTKQSVIELVWKAMRQSTSPNQVFKGAEILSDLEGYGVRQPDPVTDRLALIQKMRELDNGYKSTNSTEDGCGTGQTATGEGREGEPR